MEKAIQEFQVRKIQCMENIIPRRLEKRLQKPDLIGPRGIRANIILMKSKRRCSRFGTKLIIQMLILAKFDALKQAKNFNRSERLQKNLYYQLAL